MVIWNFQLKFSTIHKRMAVAVLWTNETKFAELPHNVIKTYGYSAGRLMQPGLNAVNRWNIVIVIGDF